MFLISFKSFDKFVGAKLQNIYAIYLRSSQIMHLFSFIFSRFLQLRRKMKYCIDFAPCNRKLMMERIQEVIADSLKGIEFEPMINIAHNYAAIEHHFGKDVIVHRKGATLARKGTIGIIPGSQGTASYIVEGLGNPDSFCSCSHGAGRVLSRKAAIKTLDMDAEVRNLEAKGIIHAIRCQDDMQEASGAYKDIEEVIANESDLVKVKTKLLPIAVIKG